MSFWNDVWQWMGFGSCGTQDSYSVPDDNCINPCNGQPMVGGCGGVDVEGNPYGFDRQHSETGFCDAGWHGDSMNSHESGFSGGAWDD